MMVKIQKLENKIHLLECKMESHWDFNEEKQAKRVFNKIQKLIDKISKLKEDSKNVNT